MDTKERLKEIEEMIDKIQRHIDGLQMDFGGANEFVTVTDFRKAMNDTELAFHEVRKVYERRNCNQC